MLSEDVMLGSTMISLDPRDWWVDDTCGCLIGMGMAARGLNDQSAASKEARYLAVVRAYPWLAESLSVPKLLSEAKGRTAEEYLAMWAWHGTAKVAAIISCMAYMVKEGSLTLEQAVDWIRANEPKEPEVQTETQEVRDDACVGSFDGR